MSEDNEPTAPTESTPTPAEADIPTAAVAVAEPPVPTAPATPPPASTDTKRERSYIRIPSWLAVVLGVVVLGGGGFVVGRETAPDHSSQAISSQAPSVGNIPGLGNLPGLGNGGGNGNGNGGQGSPTASGAFLGVSIQDAAGGGAQVAEVSSGSPADSAGLHAGDIVTKIDGTDVSDAAGLRQAVAKHDPGDNITITYTRDGTSHEARVQLADRADAGN